MKNPNLFRRLFVIGLSITMILITTLTYGQKKATAKPVIADSLVKSSLVSGLKFRSIGPAFTSGRIADFAVNPKNYSEFYVAVACGHIWKTSNNGTTFEPVFDNYGAYSIGCLAMDPNNSNVVWAGTGENNHQRAVGYGDGVYKTVDGGKSWTNMGLKQSRQIGMILIDPRNSDVVYVAAEGSIWGPGGERGLYKTTDGGKTWNKVLNVSDNTGINNVICDPRNPDVLYATSEQRRRHVFTKIGGGPETAVYKSEDAGKSWRKLTSGLPSDHMGGMGIAISPQNPDVLYLIIEAANNSGGFFRSADRGESWSKMSDHTSQGQYYNEIYCDPVQFDKIYSVETISQSTDDGGKTWYSIGNNERHVDDHAFWVNPKDNKHYMIGGDGGVYISYDKGENWRFVSNLPVTQFYRVTTDNAEPFYNVYGGTQDNNTLGGPSRNIVDAGVNGSEWVVTVGGDGFWPAVDPTNPDIVYSEWQYGNIVRYDKKSGERIYIKPQPRKGEKTYKWNWDTPLLISPHSPSRLYIAANKVFRSDDRGNTWQVISEDLTTQTDRNTWPVMGKFWSVDAVGKDVSTSLWGTIVAMDESSIKENLLYIGTDDGLVQITEDAKTWRKAGAFPGVPEYSYVSDVFASRFEENVVYATVRNMKRDDFKPCVFKSSDKGKTWVSISSNLPMNGSTHSIIQDYEKKNLLFVGTEFGVFFTINEGQSWVQLSSGIPTVGVYDLTIQKRECDLLAATFGRGIYIIDNFSPLRDLTGDFPNKANYLFNVKDALLYIPDGKKYGQGSTPYYASNPDYGATFYMYIKDIPKTSKEIRQENEKKLFDQGKPVPQLTLKELENESKEIPPYLLLNIKDKDGSIIRTVTQKPSKGINRYNWDLKYNDPRIDRSEKFDPFAKKDGGIYVLPGNYSVDFALIFNGKVEKLAEQKTFNVIALNNTTLPAKNRDEMVKFQLEVSKLSKSMVGAFMLTRDLKKELVVIKQTLLTMPSTHEAILPKIDEIEKELNEIQFIFTGEEAKASWEEIPPANMPLYNRLDDMVQTQISSTSDITGTSKTAFEILKSEYPPVLERIKVVAETKMPELRKLLDQLNAPYTPGRIIDWK